jgi:hypothetical protein
MQDDHDKKAIDTQVQRLILVQTKMRWALVIFLWLTLGIISLWMIREDIGLWIEYFTWAAVRVAIRNEQLPYMGLGVCVALTLSTLIRQSWDILFGINKREYHYLVKQVQKIETQGRKHWLWQWVIG